MSKLAWLFLAPFLSSVIIFCLPSVLSKYVQKISFMCSLIPLVFLGYYGDSWLTESICMNWLSQLSIQFHLSIDSLSLLFLYVVALIIPISIVSAHELENPQLFFGLILFLQGLLIGFFTSQDLVVFTIFWEAMLLPIYFLMVGWGEAERKNAAFKFILYMISGSVFMIIAVLSLYFSQEAIAKTCTFNINSLAQIASQVPHAPILAAIFLLAFVVKTPLFPFHAWLADSYCQSTIPVSILLSAVLSKAGVYGIMRIAFTVFPPYVAQWSPFLLGCSIVGAIYGAFAAWSQNDYKRLIAYSSLSHVNFILAGLFILDQTAHMGALLQVFNHAITITGLFLVAKWLEDRTKTWKMERIEGLTQELPHLSWLTFFFVLSSIALPGLNNFIGELLIFFGLFKMSIWAAALLGLTTILSVLYMLSWMHKVFFGPFRSSCPLLVDIRTKEIFIALPLVLLILGMGIYPKPVIEKIKPATVIHVMTTVRRSP